MKLLIAGRMAATALLAGTGLARADFVLISDEEAAQARRFIAERGPNPSPSIKFDGPIDGVPVKSPFDFVVKYSAHAGAQIDVESIRVNYMLARDPIDLTQRVRKFIGPDEMRVTGARVPRGRHQLQIKMQDSNGELRTAYFTFCVEICEPRTTELPKHAP